MPNKDVEQIAQYEWKFSRSLNEARKRIDLSTVAGQRLDKILTPLYKKYGFYDSRRLLVDLNANKIPDKNLQFFKLPRKEQLISLGIDMDFYDSLNDANPAEVMKLRDTAWKAEEALREVSKKLTFEQYTSGNTAWDIFGYLHWVTDFYSMLEHLKHHQKESITSEQAAITEYLQKLIYYKPKSLDLIIKETAKHFEKEEFFVIDSFKSITGITPKKYAETLKEALGDYVKNKALQFATDFANRPDRQQRRVIAQAKAKSIADATALLSDWNKLVVGNPQAATPYALTQYLTKKNIEPAVVAAILKKYKKQFVKENISITEDYLPAAQLRNFFSDVINSHRTYSLQPPQKAPKTKSTTTTAATNTPAPSTPAPTPVVAPKAPKPTASSTPTPPATASVKTQTANIGDVQKIIQTLPANLRSQAILQALPSLTDEQIKEILNSLVTRKK